MKNKLYSFVRRKSIAIGHVAEVGVYYPETSNIIDFINDEVRTTLVEADPLCVKRIEAYFEGRDNVNIYPYAVWDKNEMLVLYRTKASTFVGSLEKSPALINDSYKLNEEDKFTTEAKRFSDIDDGTIDLLSIDIEGAEWYVIKYLKSRPAIISLETQADKYINPYLNEINDWMKNNNYKIWFLNDTDTVFIKDGIIDFNPFEKVLLGIQNYAIDASHKIRKWRKTVKKMILHKKDS